MAAEIKPRISLIVAMNPNRVIGIQGRLPWHLPADLKHFKQLTWGKPILMGRKTWQSLPGLLPGRPHIIISRQKNYRVSGAWVKPDLDSGLAQAAELGDEIMIIGGAEIYQHSLKKAHRIYLTLVQADIQGDAFFPELSFSDWLEIDRQDYASDANNPYHYSFIILDKRG